MLNSIRPSWKAFSQDEQNLLRLNCIIWCLSKDALKPPLNLRMPADLS